MIGEPARRVEDRRLLTGAGRFTDDFAVDDAAYGVFVRAPHAHAEILSIQKSEALGLDGVIGIFDAGDMAAANAVATGIAGRGRLYPNRLGLDSRRI